MKGFDMNWFILIILFVTTVLDAFRDRWIPKRCRGEAWLAWHLVKWGAFFLPLILLSYIWLDQHAFKPVYIAFFVAFAIFCNVVWNVIYKFKK